MSLLSYLDLCDLVHQGVITGLEDTGQINASSIDVRLGDILICEHPNDRYNIVDPHLRNNFHSYRVNLAEGPYQLAPGQFVLASTVEVFNLPMDITGEFGLKSSGARSGLNNLFACHCDPGWNGSSAHTGAAQRPPAPLHPAHPRYADWSDAVPQARQGRAPRPQLRAPRPVQRR